MSANDVAGLFGAITAIVWMVAWMIGCIVARIKTGNNDYLVGIFFIGLGICFPVCWFAYCAARLSGLSA